MTRLFGISLDNPVEYLPIELQQFKISLTEIDEKETKVNTISVRRPFNMDIKLKVGFFAPFNIATRLQMVCQRFNWYNTRAYNYPSIFEA